MYFKIYEHTDFVSLESTGFEYDFVKGSLSLL